MACVSVTHTSRCGGGKEAGRARGWLEIASQTWRAARRRRARAPSPPRPPAPSIDYTPQRAPASRIGAPTPSPTLLTTTRGAARRGKRGAARGGRHAGQAARVHGRAGDGGGGAGGESKHGEEEEGGGRGRRRFVDRTMMCLTLLLPKTFRLPAALLGQTKNQQT